MTALTEAKIKEIVEKNTDHGALVAKLTEEAYLKGGAKVFVTSSMGMSNVEGTFVEENNGWAKVKREDGTEFWVLYHTVKPKA